MGITTLGLLLAFVFKRKWKIRSAGRLWAAWALTDLHRAGGHGYACSPSPGAFPVPPALLVHFWLPTPLLPPLGRADTSTGKTGMCCKRGLMYNWDSRLSFLCCWFSHSGVVSCFAEVEWQCPLQTAWPPVNTATCFHLFVIFAVSWWKSSLGYFSVGFTGLFLKDAR